MNHCKPELVHALRDTAARLQGGARYEWGHMGRCNCGHLVQTLTQLSDREIVATIEYELDEWTEHARDYCEGTGQPLEHLFEQLAGYGFGTQDIIHLENLSDGRVRERLGGRYLRKNQVSDVTVYMETLADILEATP